MVSVTCRLDRADFAAAMMDHRRSRVRDSEYYKRLDSLIVVLVFASNREARQFAAEFGGEAAMYASRAGNV